MEIVIDQLNKNYGDVQALKQVSVSIADGEMFFLLGASGCGKTTLLRSIGGFEKPSSGRILINGCDVTDLPPYERPTGMVFQGYALWPHKTVWENVAFGLEMQKVRKSELEQRVETALRQVQILDLAKRKPNELSGGQQQRVALARTLVTKPGVLLLDEPLANLDAKLRRDMRLEIRRLCKDAGLTAIYVTHDRQEALSMADRIAVMQNGQIIQLGTPQEVYRYPINAFVASFIGEANVIDGKIDEMNAENGWIRVNTPLGMVQADCARLKAQFSVGDAVQLSIRPESIALLNDASSKSAANAFTVEIAEAEYLGEVMNYTCRYAEDKTLKFSVLNPQGSLPLFTQVRISISASDVCLMRKLI